MSVIAFAEFASEAVVGWLEDIALRPNTPFCRLGKDASQTILL